MRTTRVALLRSAAQAMPPGPACTLTVVLMSVRETMPLPLAPASWKRELSPDPATNDTDHGPPLAAELASENASVPTEAAAANPVPSLGILIGTDAAVKLISMGGTSTGGMVISNGE